MKRYLLFAVLFFFAVPPSRAQTQTNVTATVKDPIGIPYANGTFSIQLIPSGTNPTVNGNSIGGAFNGATDSTGTFSASLWPNASISPAGTQWQVTVCISPGVVPPLGTGPQCTPPTVVTIAGVTQSLSATLNAVTPLLTTITLGAGSVASVTATAPIVVTPSPLTNVGVISCPTCSTSSSTIPLNNVVSPTGSIATFADGNFPLIFNCALTSGTTCMTVGETTAATTAGAVGLQLTTLTTSTAVPLKITQGAAGPAGANAPNAIDEISPATGGAASGASNGFTGAGIRLFGGAGSTAGATGNFGGTGGTFFLFPGAGGACIATGCQGGAAGGFNITTAAGGAGGATGPGGAGGGFNFIGGNGGSGGGTSGSGGVGSAFTIQPGNGGPAAAGSTAGTGGDFIVRLGASAAGAGTPARPGIFLITGATVAGANTSPTVQITDTWNTSGVVDAGILLQIINTASGAGSLLMDLQVGGISKYKTDVTGITTGAGTFISGIDNSAAGSFQAANSASAAHTIWGSAATTTNTILGFATAPATGDIVTCTVSGTTCTLTDGGAPATPFNPASPGPIGGTTPAAGTFTTLTAATFNTTTNCTSSASPAVCGSAAAGSVVVAAAATSVVVNTTAVTANSIIVIQFDSSLGTKLGVTCNATVDLGQVTARTAATSFTITSAAAPAVNPACYSYTITN